MWQPIETAPKNDTCVDIYSAMHGRCTEMRRTVLSKTNIFYRPNESGYSCVRDATHWMPLPPPPEQNK